MPSKILRAWLLLLTIPYLLVGCGFHLQGKVALPPSLNHVYVKTPDPYGQLARQLRNYLKMSGIQVTTSADNAKTIIEILREDPSQQLLSVSGTQQTRQYSLILTVVFQVTNAAGDVLVEPQTVRETTTLTIQSNQILASSNETSVLYQEMRRASVYDIINRLASTEISALLTTPTKPVPKSS